MEKLQNKHRKNMYIKRFLVSFLLVLILPIGCFSYMFLHNFRLIYREKIIDQAQNSLVSAGMELEREIDSLFSIVTYNEQKRFLDLRQYPVNYEHSELASILQLEMGTHSILKSIYYYNSMQSHTIYSYDGTWNIDYFSRVCYGESQENFVDRLLGLKKRGYAFEVIENVEGEKSLHFMVRGSVDEWWIFVLSEKPLKQIIQSESTVVQLLNKDEKQLYAIGELDDENKFYELSFRSPKGYFSLLRFADEDLLFSELNSWQTFFLFSIMMIMVFGGILIFLLTNYVNHPFKNFVSYCRETVQHIPEELDNFEVFQYAMKSMEEQIALYETRQKRNQLLTQMICGLNHDEEYFESVVKREAIFRMAECYRVVLIVFAEGYETSINRVKLYLNLTENNLFEYHLLDVENSNIHVVIVGMKEADEQNLEKELRKMAEAVISDTEEEIHFYVGSVCQELNQLSMSYFQALTSYRSKEETKQGKRFYYRTAHRKGTIFHYSNKELKELYYALIEIDLDRAFSITDKLVERMFQCEIQSFEWSTIYYDLLNTYYRALVKLEADLDSEFLEMEFLEINNTVNINQVISDIKMQFQSYVEGVKQDSPEKKTKPVNVAIKDSNKNRKKEDVILQIISYIESNRNSADLCVSMVSDHFGMSISYLSHKFKAKVGSNISDYITERKFDYACELLTETDYNVNEIAFIIGYSASISFIRKFKALYGVTPAEYRKEKRKLQ